MDLIEVTVEYSAKYSEPSRQNVDLVKVSVQYNVRKTREIRHTTQSRLRRMMLTYCAVLENLDEIWGTIEY